MRWDVAIVACALGIAGAAGTAAAEKVKANQDAKLYSHAGEAGEVLLKIHEGQAMTVLARDGRWIKVRVNGRTGWVPRTKVDEPAADGSIQRNTRRRPFVDGRGTHRGFGGEAGPDDRVGEDAVGEGAGSGGGGGGGGGDDSDDSDKPKHKPAAHDDDDDKPKHKPAAHDDEDKPRHDDKPRHKPAAHDDDSDSPLPTGKGEKGDKGDKGEQDGPAAEDQDPSDTRAIVHVTRSAKVLDDPKKGATVAFKATPRTKLYVEKTQGKWTEVSLDEGDAGWVLTSQLDLASSEAAIGKRRIDVRVGAGMKLISEGLRSAGTTAVGAPNNYNLGESAGTLALGAQYLMPYKHAFLLGGGFSYDYSRAIGGLPGHDATSNMSTNTTLTLHDVEVVATGGYDFHKASGVSVLARVGYHYESFLVKDVGDYAAKNGNRVPSETDKGIILGAALWIPRLTGKIGGLATVDTVFIAGSVKQTAGLDDGNAAVPFGVRVGLQLAYRWKPMYELQASYNLEYAKIDFGAPDPTSQRMQTGTDITRTDILHTVTVAIDRQF